MQAEIIVIGTELLLGQIIDTNAAYIAQQLSSLGIDLYYKSTVGDNKGRIVETLQRAVDRSDLVLTTGGIGPTLDDMTRESVAEVLGVPLELHPNLLEQIKAMMGNRYTENKRPAGICARRCAADREPGWHRAHFRGADAARRCGGVFPRRAGRNALPDGKCRAAVSQGALSGAGGIGVTNAEVPGADRELH